MNWNQDLLNGAVVTHAATFFARTTDLAGSSLDLGLADGQHSAVLVAGALTDGTHTYKLQESTDGSNNWTDITGGGFAAITGNTTNQHAVKEVINFKNTKRYARATAAVAAAATTGGGVMGVIVIARKKLTGASVQTTV